MKQDKFLTGIILGVGVLVVVALGVFFLRREEESYMAEDTPDGVVHNYVLAIQQDDYDKAYSYLAEGEGKPDKLAFASSFSESYRGYPETGVQIVGYELIKMENGQEGAVVDLVIVQSPGGLFGELYDYKDTAVLVKQGGAWKLVQMPYAYWRWGWYETGEFIPLAP